MFESATRRSFIKGSAAPGYDMKPFQGIKTGSMAQVTCCRIFISPADIYYEYGFTQVMRAEYVDGRGKSIKLEIFEMESPTAVACL